MNEDFDLKHLISSAHRMVEAREGGSRISIGSMSKRMGISHRTLTEYERGTNQPMSMKALLLLLAQVSDEQIIELVRRFQAAASQENHNE